MNAAVVVQPELSRVGVVPEMSVLTGDRAVHFGSVDKGDLVRANHAGSCVANFNPSSKIDSLACELVGLMFGGSFDDRQLDARKQDFLFSRDFDFSHHAREAD